MSKVIYLSYQRSEGMMESIGLTLMTIQKSDNFSLILRKLLKQNISIVYVSEEIYRNYKEIIDSYDKEFGMTITILANTPKRSKLAENRFERLVEDAIGIRLSEEEKS